MIKQHDYQHYDGLTTTILVLQFDGQTPPLATQWSNSTTNNAIKH